MKIGIIGGGTMGSAFAKSLIKKNIISPNELLIVESDNARQEAARANFRCQVSPAPDTELNSCAAIILAVKPQDFRASALELVKHLESKPTLIISFMAGIRLETISQLLERQPAVVRVMPNLPFSISQGMAVFISSAGVQPAQKELARSLLNACGLSLEVKDESLLDSATAISGTGPGYVFYFIEHLLCAAGELGFSEQEAKLIIGQTLVGSIELWRQGEHPAEELRKMVTSKNGTTAAAVEVFEKGNLGAVMIAGIKRAGQRARELAGIPDTK